MSKGLKCQKNFLIYLTRQKQNENEKNSKNETQIYGQFNFTGSTGLSNSVINSVFVWCENKCFFQNKLLVSVCFILGVYEGLYCVF